MAGFDIPAAVSALGVIILGGLTLWQNRKIKDIHVLVNQRLTDALDQLAGAQDKVAESRESGQPVPPPRQEGRHKP